MVDSRVLTSSRSLRSSRGSNSPSRRNGLKIGVERNDDTNRIRDRVTLWQNRDYPDLTATTRRLLHHWADHDRENKLFFQQVEALDTVICLPPCF